LKHAKRFGDDLRFAPAAAGGNHGLNEGHQVLRDSLRMAKSAKAILTYATASPVDRSFRCSRGGRL
jgi:hypothetical protein